MSSSDEGEQQPQGSSDQWAPSGRSSEDDHDGGASPAPQVNNLGLLQHAGGAHQQQQEAETRTQPNHNEQLMRMLASYGGTAAGVGGQINAGGLLRPPGEQGGSVSRNIYNTNEAFNMGTAHLAGPPSGSRIDILSAVVPGNVPTATAAAAAPNEQDDHQQQQQRPSKRARIKKPDSGYSIFFRTQRQLLEDTGESVEHAYEREVAPLSTLDDERNRSKALVKLVAARWKRLGRLERMKYDIIAEEQRIQIQEHHDQQQGEEEQEEQEQQQSHQPQPPLHSTTLPTSAEQTAAGNPPQPANMVVPIIQMILTAQRLPSLTPALIVALAQVPASSLEQASLILKIILDTKKNMEAARTTQQTLQWLVTSILHPHGSGSNNIHHQTPVPAAVAAPVFPPRHPIANNNNIQPWPPPTNVAAAGDLARILAEQMMARGATRTTAATTSQGNSNSGVGGTTHHLPATVAAPSQEGSSVGSASRPSHHRHHHHHHHRQEGGAAADHIGMAAPSTAAGFPTTNTTTGAPQPQPLPLPPLAATWQSSSSAPPPPPNTAVPPEGCCIS